MSARYLVAQLHCQYNRSNNEPHAIDTYLHLGLDTSDISTIKFHMIRC